jgi:aspartate racemase
MKKIGLIGGMSWESTQIYYQIMNQRVKALVGGHHSCKILLESLDFAEVEQLQYQNDWKALDQMMVDAARVLEHGGAELLVLCTNTMHLCADAIKSNTSIPFLHIADATGARIQQDGLKKILLLGTKFTMEKDFYRNLLENTYGIEVCVPEKPDRDIIHQIIYKELVQGITRDTSRSQYLHIIEKAISKGAQGVVLGCTEIPLLIKKDDVDIRVYDTTAIHAEAAIDFALS